MLYKKSPTLFDYRTIQTEAEYINGFDDNEIYSANYSPTTLRHFHRIFQDYYQQPSLWKSYTVGSIENRIQKLHKIMVRTFYDLVESKPASQQLRTLWRSYAELLSQHSIFSVLRQQEKLYVEDDANERMLRL
jgi:hypothetical protein